MLDHLLGRPSAKSRRLQVLAVISFWSLYLHKGDKHGPPGAKFLSRIFSKTLTAWQTFILTMLYLYIARNFSSLVGLASPEPMANMYDSTFYRATWILTAMDAGFWTAMKIRTKWLRDMASIVFTVFYLFAAEQADEKVRKVRGAITVEHMRVSWNKGTTPYLRALQSFTRPRFTRWPPRQVRIPRPSHSDYRGYTTAWLYFDGPLSDLENCSKLILDLPGGGFVAMDPRCNDDKLLAWAGKSGLPILSLDYKKAPEYPYPYALNECFDVYTTIIETKGRCIGMSGKNTPRVIITGDSAGGNLAVSITLMMLENNDPNFCRSSPRGEIPLPDGLVCFYPALDMNIGSWMSDEQMALIRDQRVRKTNRPVVRRKSQLYEDLVGTPHHSDDDDDTTPSSPGKLTTSERSIDTGVSLGVQGTSTDAAVNPRPEFSHSDQQRKVAKSKAGPTSSPNQVEPIKTRIAVSSGISYFNDRLLTPELMRAMVVLYIGPHNRPDFASDYLLSPVLAPEALLSKFPKTYFMTGERDPLVDDTVIFSSRLRLAKTTAARIKYSEPCTMNGGSMEQRLLDDSPEVVLIPKISHGFLQFPSVYAPTWKHFDRIAKWFGQIYSHVDKVKEHERHMNAMRQQTGNGYSMVESSGDEDRPLEMSMTRIRSIPRSSTPAADYEAHGTSPPETNGYRRPKKANAAETGKGKGLAKDKSLVKLTSSDDLIGRRMQGLTSGLAGLDDDD